MTLTTTPDVQNAAWLVLEAIEDFADTVLNAHDEYLGMLAEHSAMANLDQVRCWFRMVAEQKRLS